jgi:peptidyl-dipeptidase A
MKISLTSIVSIGAALVSCATTPPRPAAPATPPPATAEGAQRFVAEVSQNLQRLSTKDNVAQWIKATYITDDTEQNAAWADDDLLAAQTAAVKNATRFDGVSNLDAETARQLLLIKFNDVGPDDPKEREEETQLAAKLEGLYGKGKWCGPDGKARCRDLQELQDVLAKSHDQAELLDAWAGWHTISREMKPLYARYVELQNKAARNIGFADEGAFWRARYDMPADDFEKELDRLWGQVKPLYDDLHCYVRGKLQATYGKQAVPDGKPIPAHLLGNMWAQEWNNVWKLVEPYQGVPSLDATKAIEQQKWDAKKIVRTGEAFYTSLGMDPLPETFWQRSQLVKPPGREVVCHASAWNVLVDNDLRIKMCIKPTQEDLETVHHELGHNYYEHYYYKLPWLYHGGANDGFHEAIGDSLVLSMTPGYLKQLGLINQLPSDEKGLIEVQLKDALTRIAFLPFGLLIDKWRWEVFSGKVSPDHYNEAWWALREKYQGVSAPLPRSETDFDPGAKYHVPANVPYARYFLARILQYQFHRAMCQASGFKGPLHECSVYGSKEAGARLKSMLALGASKPWQDALETMTGSREMDATAILDYFAPLQAWLKEQNKGQKCGW